MIFGCHHTQNADVSYFLAGIIPDAPLSTPYGIVFVILTRYQQWLFNVLNGELCVQRVYEARERECVYIIVFGYVFRQREERNWIV